MVSDLRPPSNDTVIFFLFSLFSLQNALNTAAKIGGQLYKASEAEGDTRDALFQVRESKVITRQVLCVPLVPW